MIKLADKWKDYTVVATGNGNKLENWAGVVLLRPDPQVVWKEPFALDEYKGLNAIYCRDNTGGGKWDVRLPFKEEWTISYKLSGIKVVKLLVRPMGFKHTGVFPEQAVNWDVMYKLISDRISIDPNKRPSILNLFGYTGAASVACALAGAKTTHVDAAKNMVGICKQNAQLNGINDIRYIVDDCNKFVEREVKRGNKYDGIIMDPPSYGRGPNNEPWKLTENIFDFVQNTAKLLSQQPLFFLLNSYTTGLQPSVLQNILNINLPKGVCDACELAIPTLQRGVVLPCGCSGLWQA